MIDERDLLEQELERFAPQPGMFERVTRRRDRKLRRQRVAAGVLGLAIATAVTVAGLVAFNDSRETGDERTPSPTPTPIQTPTPTPTPVVEWPEPLVVLGPGYRFVDVTTGEATRFPSTFTSIPGATNFDVSPDGSMILFDNSEFGSNSSRRLDGVHQLFVANVDGSGLHQLTNDPIGALSGSWSPDGRKIVYVGGWTWGVRGVNLSTVDLDTGAVERLTGGRITHLWDPFFSADGNTVLFTRYPGRSGDPDREDLWSIPVNGGAPELFLEDRGGSAQLSPGGASLTYRWIETIRDSTGRCGSDYGVGWISDADGSDPRLIAPNATAEARSSSVATWSPDSTRIAYRLSLPRVPEGCSWFEGPYGVHVLDAESGITTLVTYGWPLDWVDDHTLLVRTQGGDQPTS